MKRLLYILAACVTFALVTTACGNSKKENTISGKAGEVIVVAPKPVWNSELGEMLKDSLMKECPYLPQREAMYTLVHVPNNGFTRMFKIHRNIIYLNISDDVKECRFVVRRDPWAHPQILFYVDAADAEAAYNLLQENMQTILSELEKIEIERVIDNTASFQNPALAEKVKSFLGAQMLFPNDYSLKKDGKDFLWISYETKYVQQGFFIYRTPATRAEDELSLGSLVNLRNKALKANVPGSRDGSYMTTADYLTPGYRIVEHDSIEVRELRGLWELENDYMGGPFVSHSFYSPDSTQVISIEAYVYAPKHDKRIFMRQAESLLYSFKWESF